MNNPLFFGNLGAEIIVIALIVTFLPITLPFKIVLAMVAMACFYFGRKYYHNHKNGGAETPSMSSAESEALATGILKALGVKNNIVKVDYCATRLRFEVHSYASVDEAAAKILEARAEARAAKNWDLADAIRDQLKDLGLTIEDTAAGTRIKSL